MERKSYLVIVKQIDRAQPIFWETQVGTQSTGEWVAALYSIDKDLKYFVKW